jgi:hypothetical protein
MRILGDRQEYGVVSGYCSMSIGFDSVVRSFLNDRVGATSHPTTHETSLATQVFEFRSRNEESKNMSSFSFQRQSRVNDGASWEEFVGKGLDLSAKLGILQDFLSGRSNPAITQEHVDITASSISRLLAAYTENPYVIRDYTNTPTNPREIMAPEQTWGSLKRSPNQEDSRDPYILELHNNQGRIELPLKGEEIEAVISQIALHRAKCA